MKKRHLIALLLVVVIACGGFLLFNSSDSAILENGKNSVDEFEDGEIFLEDEDVPLSDLPTDLPQKWHSWHERSFSLCRDRASEPDPDPP